MRILSICGDLHLPRDLEQAGASGAVNVALETSRALVEQGHEAWVAAVGKGAWSTTWHGVRLVQLNAAPYAKLAIAGRSLDFRIQLPYIALTRRYRFDVVQGYLHHYLRFLRARLRAVNMQIDPLYDGEAARPMAAADFATLARTTDVQVAASGFVAGQLNRAMGREGNVSVVYNGVDLARFDQDRYAAQRAERRAEWGISSSGVVFLYAGAFVPEKGVLELARAFNQIRAQVPDAHLVLAGGSSLWLQNLSSEDPAQNYEHSVRQALDAARLEKRAHFLGLVSRDELPSIYASCDVVVVPSVWQEAFGLVALEGLATGKAAIASATGGLQEIVGDDCALLTPPGDIPALASALRTLATDTGRRTQLAGMARARAHEFSWKRTATALECIYAANLRRKTGVQPCVDS